MMAAVEDRTRISLDRIKYTGYISWNDNENWISVDDFLALYKESEENKNYLLLEKTMNGGKCEVQFPPEVYQRLAVVSVIYGLMPLFTYAVTIGGMRRDLLMVRTAKGQSLLMLAMESPCRESQFYQICFLLQDKLSSEDFTSLMRNDDYNILHAALITLDVGIAGYFFYNYGIGIDINFKFSNHLLEIKDASVTNLIIRNTIKTLPLDKYEILNHMHRMLRLLALSKLANEFFCYGKITSPEDPDKIEFHDILEELDILLLAIAFNLAAELISEEAPTSSPAATTEDFKVQLKEFYVKPSKGIRSLQTTTASLLTNTLTLFNAHDIKRPSLY